MLDFYGQLPSTDSVSLRAEDLSPMYHVLFQAGVSLAQAPSLASPLWLKGVCMAVAADAKAEDSAC